MALDKCIEQIFPIKCCGRDNKGEYFLEKSVDVTLTICQRLGNEEIISSIVNCPYNAGGHGQRCIVSDSNKKVDCPYSFDIPYALEKNKE